MIDNDDYFGKVDDMNSCWNCDGTDFISNGSGHHSGYMLICSSCYETQDGDEYLYFADEAMY